MKIVIDPFDRKSIQKAITKLHQYERSFKRKEKTFIRRLAEIGVTVASGIFETAGYDGTKDVTVTSTQDGSCAVITAFGTTVGFIEFGTGIRNPEWSGTGVDYRPPERGSYGKGRGKNPGFWYYYPAGSDKAVRSTGNPPAEAMLSARNDMVAQIAQIAREVFG